MDTLEKSFLNEAKKAAPLLLNLNPLRSPSLPVPQRRLYLH